MTPIPLDQIRFGWHDHKSALWWIGLLYRRPVCFVQAFENFSLRKGLGVALFLWLHALPYILCVFILGRFVVFGLLGRQPYEPWTGPWDVVEFHILGVASGISTGVFLGLIFGCAGGITFGVPSGIAIGIAPAIVAGIAEGIAGEIGDGIADGIIIGILGGTACGIPFGITEGIASGITRGTLGTERIASRILSSINPKIAIGVIGISFGFVIAIPYAIVLGIIGGVYFGIAAFILGGIGFGIPFGIPLGTTGRIGWLIASGVAVGIVGLAHGIPYGLAYGIPTGTIGGITFIICVLRLWYQPIHTFFLRFQGRHRWYPVHPVAWDDTCAVPFPGLDNLLVEYTDEEPEDGRAAIERLIDNFPSQRLAALRAKVVLVAKEAAQVTDLTQLSRIVGQLPLGEKEFLGQIQNLRELVNEISRIQIELNTINRPVFRKPVADLLCQRIESFRHQIGGFHKPLANEFQSATRRWLNIARRQLEEAETVLSKKPTPQVFRAGNPVKRDSEAFVPRNRVVGELEQQIMSNQSCPCIVIYGRRRIGKSTVLQNLTGFLQSTVAPVIVLMQDPNAFSSLQHFVHHLQQEVGSQLKRKVDTEFSIENRKPDLPSLFRFLADCNARFDAEGRRLLLAFDEYEMIDIKIGEGKFSEDLLATIRESIQTHRRITWVFAGSHEITELDNAGWTSYLISAQTIEVPVFTAEETRLLLTEPVKYSSSWEKNDPERPSFAPEFWGDGGIERIHSEAGGWPHLVQLIAEKVVDLLNDEGSREVDADLLERALNLCIVRGHNVLYELMYKESELEGEWDYLSAFRSQSTQPLPDSEAVRQSLRRRLLVKEENGFWRLRVPLMARWLRERG